MKSHYSVELSQCGSNNCCGPYQPIMVGIRYQDVAIEIARAKAKEYPYGSYVRVRRNDDVYLEISTGPGTLKPSYT